MSDALINPERALEYWNDQAQEEQDNNSEDNLLGWGESAWRGFNSGYQRAYGAAIRGLNVATHNDDRLYWEAITSGERTDAPAAGEDPLKEDWWEGFFAEADRDLQRAARRNDADPSTQSMAGSIIYPVTQMLTQATVGSPGGPFGSALSVAGAQGVTSYDTARSEGLNPDQAMGMALREGGFMGAMTLLPAAIGGRLLTRIGTGAGINLATGAGYRYELNRYLTEEGFPELAARYRWDDAQAAAIDAILGAAFGALPHSGRAGRAEPIPQELSDAALVAGADLRRRTQFGIPTNDASRRWAAEASARMEEQAARDEPIDPGPMPEGVDFVPLPESGAPEWDGAMRAFEEEARAQGLDDVASRIRRLREERPDAFDGDEGALFSMRRGLGEERGRARFYDERLTDQQNKAVEMRRNAFSPGEAADEMQVSESRYWEILKEARDAGVDVPRAQPGPPRTVRNEVLRLTRENPRFTSAQIAERVRSMGYSTTSRSVRRAWEMLRAEGALPPAAGPRQRGALFSQAAEVQGFSTVEELQARASEILGADWGALSRAGKVEIVQSSADVPAPMGLPRGVQAVHMRDTGTSYFIANNIRPEDLYGLVLHEVGVHNGFETMLGKRGFNEVLRQIERMVDEDHPAMVEARGYAERYAANEAHVPEETLAYLIETHADLPLVQRVLSRIRQWLIKTFGSTFGMRLTVDDLRALAITSLRRVAEQARREAGDVVAIDARSPLFSNGPDAGQSGAGSLARFMEGDQSSAWIDVGDYRVYLRKSSRWLDGAETPTLELATITRIDGRGTSEVLPAGQRGPRGHFSQLVADLEREAAQRGYGAVYVENMGNKFLPGVFERRGYVSDAEANRYNPRMPSAYRRLDSASPSPDGGASRGEQNWAEGIAALRDDGFDVNTPLYHATGQNFEQFDVGRAGSGANAGLREDAIFLTDSPAVADSYLGGGYVRSENARGASADMGDGVARWYQDGSNVRPVYVRPRNMEEWDFGGGGYTPADIKRAIREARESGANGVVIRNIRDPGLMATNGPVGNPRRPSNLVIVFNPEDVTPRFPRTGEASYGANAPRLVPERAATAQSGDVAPSGRATPSPDGGQSRAGQFPLRGYHGTGRDVRALRDDGLFWISETPELANEYAAMRGAEPEWALRPGQQPPAPNVIPVRYRIGTELDADAIPDSVTVSEFLNAAADQAAAAGRPVDRALLEDRIAELRAAARTEESGPHYSRHDFWLDPSSFFGREGAALLRRTLDEFGFDGVRLTERGHVTHGVLPRNTDIGSASRSPNAGDGGDFAKFSFGGRYARNADLSAYMDALRMWADGVPDRVIWDETGWTRGADGEWRFEIADDLAELTPLMQTPSRVPAKGAPLERVMRHDQLFRAYPELRRGVTVQFVNFADPNIIADFKPTTRAGDIPRAADRVLGKKLGRIRISAQSDPQEVLSALLHEVQHVIQARENFAVGGGTDDPRVYMRQAGEVEARNVQRRQRMTSVERWDTPPEATEDVARPDQIVLRFEDLDKRQMLSARSDDMGAPRQNGENLLGAKRDPIESPEYQRRIAELRGELGGEDGRAGRGDASLRAGEEGKRTDLGAVVAVSGLRLQTRPKGSDFGTHRATIDTPIPTDADPILQARDGAEGKHTVVDFDFIDGNNPKEVRLPGVHIRWTRLNDAAKGKGIGVWIYRQLIDWADRQGLPVYSDFAISPEAQPIYGALARRGYNVEQINPHVKGSDGFIRNQKYQPIFRISRTGVEADYDAAPPPRDDYQIDGPTLRERQTRIDEQRARQEAYDKLKPVEQVLVDDPDLPIMTDYGQPMFSRGGPQKRQYRATQLFQDARAEAEAAREMRKGFEAAARCAARHGAGGAVRGVTGGAMYVGITGNAVMMGHALGLTAAIPIGITAAPILARSANPRRYAEGRLAAAEASLRDAEARYFREGNVRGERAGLDAPASYDTPQGEPLWDNVDTSRRAGDTAQFAAPETPWQASEAELQNPGLAPEPTTFSAPGGGTTPEGGRVPPAPPSLKPQARPTDYSQDIARLFDMPEDDQ